MLTQQRIYTPAFLLLCTSSFLFFASFGMILPELPAYLTGLGGADYKGYIISLFTLAAAISRPFSGKLADNIGRTPVIFFGIFVSFLAGLFYPVVLTVSGFLLLRFLHGFSTGFTPTGTSAYVADIVPPHRRGEAMGILGLISNIGTAFGPALGSELANKFSTESMFYCASGFALCSMVLLLRLPETLENKQRFHVRFLKVGWHEIIEKRVLVPSLVMLLTLFSFGAVLTIVPDFSVHLGLENKGVFFTIYTLASLATRFLAGRVSDRFGREIVMKWALFILIIAMIYLGFSDSIFHFLVASAILGVSTGMSSPTLFAWTIDLSHDKYRGRALATLYIALEIGIGVGALVAGWVYGNEAAYLGYPFFISAGLASLALLFMLLFAKKLTPPML